MKVPFSWLREYCDPGLPAEAVAELMSTRAVEVERVSEFGAPSPEGFVVGRVLAAESHPNADRLRVCTVDAGDGERTIVCGAPNVAAGQTVPVALPGAVLPGGRELGKATLRGVQSNGMILSEAELGLGETASEILVLGVDHPGTDPDAPGGGAIPASPGSALAGARSAAGSDSGPRPGTPLSELFPLTDQVLELELTPNRPDCLGVYGVAREVHAITGAPLAAAPWEDDAEAAGPGEASDYASVTVEVPELCPRFTARVFTGVRVGPSPLWLKARLAAAGQRPISNVVDVTNYVMLIGAQPLHAFDLDRIPGGELIVRTAGHGERMRTLDGVERTFDEETVLVCDRDGPSGVAGIMGGQRSEVSVETARVLLEIANWNGVNILRTSSLLGLRTDASTRFEKQLHPELAIRAQRMASKLLVELGAELVPGTIDVAAEPPAPHLISLRGARLNSLLGTHIDREEARAHLEALEFEVEPVGERDLRVAVPVDRYYDVSREADVIEEVGRLHGLDRIPRTLPASGERIGGLTRDQALRRRAEDVLRDLGLDEVMTWRFVAPDLPDRLGLSPDDERRRAIRTHNPISVEHAALRTTLLGGLLDAARHNLARDAERVALFESGRVYLSEPAPEAGGSLAGAAPGRMPPPAAEPHRIGALVVGPLAPSGWRGSGQATGFFDLKGVLETACAQLGVEIAAEASGEPFLHPGRAARVAVAGEPIGWLGEVHPRIAGRWDLPAAAGFEIDLAPIVAAASIGAERYEDVTTYPALYQDIAAIVPEKIPTARVRAAVLGAGGELLRSARVFDLYRGEQVGAGRKSLALRLEFRASDRTLTDEEVAPLREAIRAAVAELGGALRE
jgi:phenylalanyl-tRNA synthetase beta chain